MVCSSRVNPIKINLKTKEKHTQSRENSEIGVRSDSRRESKVTDGKKRQARFEGTEGVPDCIALLFPPSSLWKGLPVLKRRRHRGHCNKCHL